MLKQGLEQVLKGADLLLTQFAAFTDNFCRLPFLFIAKAPVFRDRTSVPFFLYAAV
jgi:hypothetical protein